MKRFKNLLAVALSCSLLGGCFVNNNPSSSTTSEPTSLPSSSTTSQTTEVHSCVAGTPVREEGRAATCTEDGYYCLVTYCAICGEEMNKEYKKIPATGHNFGNPTYTWNDGDYYCTAKRVCLNPGCGYEIEKVHSTLSVDTFPTDVTDGSGTYVAEFENENFETQIKESSIKASLEKLVFELIDGGYEVKANSDKIGGNVIVPSEYKGLPVISVGQGAFEKCADIYAIFLPETIQIIKKDAFHNRLRIEVPSSVVKVEEYGFGTETLTNYKGSYYAGNKDNPYLWCVKGEGDLEIAQIHESCEHIADCAFWPNSKLIEVIIPDSVIDIGEEAFASNLFLTSVIIGNSVTHIHENAFADCRLLSSLTLGNNIKQIDKYAFWHCLSLKELKLPESLLSIGEFAFEYCESLNALVIPNNTVTIGQCAFSCCESLETIMIGQSVKSIGSCAFTFCKKILTIVIPDSVSYIGKECFSNCASLMQVTIGSGVTEMEEQAFAFCFRLVEIINRSSIEIQTYHQGPGIQIGTYPLKIIDDQSESTLVFRNDGYVTFNNDDDVLLVNYLGDEKEITTPSYIDVINNSAFSDIPLESIHITSNVKEMIDFALSDCFSLKTVTIDRGVQKIGWLIFSRCESLESITYKGTIAEWGEIEKDDNHWCGTTSVSVVHCSNGDVSIY